MRKGADKTPGRSWEEQITINLPPRDFEVLSPPSDYRNDHIQMKLEDIPLEKEMDEYLGRDPFPLPSLQDREGYGGDRHFEYWLSGLNDYLNIKRCLDTIGRKLEPGNGILDFGAASGRLIRHFLCQEDRLDLWASDLNSRHVEWMMKFLDGKIRAFQNHTLPHLPLEDNSLDLICAFSVFTHIDVFEIAWLMELRRILKPGGIVILTIHSDHTWSIMKKEFLVYQVISSDPDFSPDLLKSRMPREKMIFRLSTDSGYRTNVFHDAGYIRRVWGAYFEILHIINEAHSYQDLVMLRKTP